MTSIVTALRAGLPARALVRRAEDAPTGAALDAMHTRLNAALLATYQAAGYDRDSLQSYHDVGGGLLHVRGSL